MPNAAVVGNNCMCPLMTPGVPPTPHGGGPILMGAPTVMICKMPAARMSDSITCAGPPPHPDTIMKGSSTVMIGGLPAAYMGSTTASGGIVMMGAATVMIGA